MRNWQSMRSVTPPCPGMSESKSFTPYARLIALARKPPNGATTLAKIASAAPWSCTGLSTTESPAGRIAVSRHASGRPLRSASPRKGSAVSAKMGCGWHESSTPSCGRNVSRSAGQMSQRRRENTPAQRKPMNTVENAAPMNPSHVLFGESLKNGALMSLRPSVTPHTYAQQSFAMTRKHGKKNQKRPKKMLCATNFIWPMTRQSVTIVHVSCCTWYLSVAARSVQIEKTKSPQYMMNDIRPWYCSALEMCARYTRSDENSYRKSPYV